MWHGAGSTIVRGVDVSVCAWVLLNVIASTRAAVCVVHARLSLRAPSMRAFTMVQAHAVHVSFALCVYRYCERVTLYSDVVKNMYMFIRYVWLVLTPLLGACWRRLAESSAGENVLDRGRR